MSWETLELDKHERSKANEIATMYFQCFNTDIGQVVLEHLVEKFLTKPIVRPGEDNFSQGIREGRADLVRQILLQIEFAKNPEQEKLSITKYLFRRK